MKNLETHLLNAVDCRKEWQEFDALLKSKIVLDERRDILPFFKKRYNMNLSLQEQDRLKWRIDRTMIDSNAISCVSFNELSDDLDYWLTTYYRV